VRLVPVLLLAVLQGIAEFLPVSSSGHLVIAGRFLGAGDQGSILLEIVLHLGTLAAVLAVYRKEILSLVSGCIRADRESLRLLGLIVLASVPAALVGILLGDIVESVFDDALVVSLLLAVNGIILLLAGRKRPGTAGVSVRSGFAAGLAQAVAVLPGISRSGSTISALVSTGVSPAGAARFSFLMSIPAVAGAALLELPGAPAPAAGELPVLAAGFAVSALVGFASLKLLLGILGKGRFWVFGIYCLAAGITAAVVLISGA
jgi:undecaprenyl-diphosphatase